MFVRPNLFLNFGFANWNRGWNISQELVCPYCINNWSFLDDWHIERVQSLSCEEEKFSISFRKVRTWEVHVILSPILLTDIYWVVIRSLPCVYRNPSICMGLEGCSIIWSICLCYFQSRRDSSCGERKKLMKGVCELSRWGSWSYL